MRRLAYVCLVLVVLGGLGAAGFLGLRSGRAEDPGPAEAPDTAEVTRGEVQETVTAPGQLVCTMQVALAPGVDGVLAEVNVRPGQAVQAGEVLARVDPDLFLAQEAIAEADVVLARARLEALEEGPQAADLAAARLELASAEADLHELTAGASAADLASAAADVASAEAVLAGLRARPDAAVVLQARCYLAKAAAALQRAQAAYDQVQGMPGAGAMPQALYLQQATIEYEAAEAANDLANRKATPSELAAAEARLASARAAQARLKAGASAAEIRLWELRREGAAVALARLEAGAAPADLAQARAALLAAEASLARARAAVRAAVLTAPFAGTVLDVSASAGEPVRAGTALVVLADPAALEVRTTVVEEDLPLVRAGQQVELFFDAFPDATTFGHVERIVPRRMAGDRPLFPIYVALDKAPAGLREGMTADASIVVESRSGVLRLPRGVVRARSDGTAVVQVWTGTVAEKRAIQVGLRGDVYVEIVDGLLEKEQVVAE